MRTYRIVKQGSTFCLYEFDKLLCSFTRATFRQTLEDLGRGSGWVGSILRLLNREFPYSPTHFSRETPEAYGLGYCIEYLENKGYRVYRPIPVSDSDIIFYLISKGYMVEESASTMADTAVKELDSGIGLVFNSEAQ